MSSRISINTDKCNILANLLRHNEIPIDQEDSRLPSLNKQQIGNFYLFLVAICHQTSPRGGPALSGTFKGKVLHGWDCLIASWECAVTTQPDLLTPLVWCDLSENKLREIFGQSLNNLQQRLDLIQNLGEVMITHDWHWLEELYKISNGQIIIGNPNLIELLSRFRAYDDPVKKKSYFLMGLMRNTGLWKYVDSQNLGPPVDYHEVRGHLRIGTVRINDPGLENLLHHQEPVSTTDDVEIRAAVHDAIMLISQMSELNNPSQLHYLFWNVFRSHCTRENPNCLGSRESNLPERYRHLAYIDGTLTCPFASVCCSVNTDNRLQEHVFETDYY